MENWGFFFSFLQDEERFADYMFPEGGSRCKLLPLGTTCPPPLSKSCDHDKSDTLEKTRHNVLPQPYEQHRSGKIICSKPTHFNEPWPTGVTESLSHVKCCHSWPRAAEMPPARTSPVSGHNHMRPKGRARLPSCSQGPGETWGYSESREPWHSSRSWSAPEEHQLRQEMGRDRGKGQEPKGQPRNDILKRKVIPSSRTRNIFGWWNGFCQMPAWHICFCFGSLEENNHLCICEKKYEPPRVYKHPPGSWHCLSPGAGFAFSLYQQIFIYQEASDSWETAPALKELSVCCRLGTRRLWHNMDVAWALMITTLQTLIAGDPGPAGGFWVIISYHGMDSFAETSRVKRSEPEKVRASSRYKVCAYKEAREGGTVSTRLW